MSATQTKEEFVAELAGKAAWVDMEKRSQKILMEMDQQIDETILRLEKMKQSRAAAALSYTKLFSVPVTTPTPPQPAQRTPQPGDSDEEERPNGTQLLLHYFETAKDTSHRLPDIRGQLNKINMSLSDPYLYDLLAKLVKARKIKRIDRGVYAHVSFKK